MPAPPPSFATELASILAEHDSRGPGAAHLRHRLETAAREVTDAAVLSAAAAPHLENPDVVAPLYERVVELEPANAHALVVLANAWWLQGRGPVAVGELATRAIGADPSHRGAWHLWALSEPDPRRRVQRWQQVSERFPEDDLAIAAVADNAASVAGAERDDEMLDLSIATFERLLERTTEPAQREAVTTALRTLRGWRL
jgi:hypothetical protein